MKKHACFVLAIVALIASLQLCACACQGPFGADGPSIPEALELGTGQDYAVDESVLGSDFTWESDDEGIAVMNENGEIVAQGPGETYITIKSGDREYRVKVVVGDGVAGGQSSQAQSGSGGSSPESTTASAQAEAVLEVEREQRDEAIEKVPLTNTVKLYGADVNAKPGDKDVKVGLFVENNPGILGMTLTVHFDEGTLSLKSASIGSAMKEALTLTKPKQFKDGCRFSWDGIDVEEHQAYDGCVLMLTFDVAESAQKGSCPISFSYESGDIVNAKLVPVDADVLDATVTVE